MFPWVFLKTDGSLSQRVLLVSKDDSLSFMQPGGGLRFLSFPFQAFYNCLCLGKASWIRPEALASILAVEMVDLPLSEAQANIEKEFSAGEQGTIKGN